MGKAPRAAAGTGKLYLLQKNAKLADSQQSVYISCTKIPEYKKLTSASFLLDLQFAYTTTGSTVYRNNITKRYDPDTGVLQLVQGSSMTGNTYILVDVYAAVGVKLRDMS